MAKAIKKRSYLSTAISELIEEGLDPLKVIESLIRRIERNEKEIRTLLDQQYKIKTIINQLTQE